MPGYPKTLEPDEIHGRIVRVPRSMTKRNKVETGGDTGHAPDMEGAAGGDGSQTSTLEFQNQAGRCVI